MNDLSIHIMNHSLKTPDALGHTLEDLLECQPPLRIRELVTLPTVIDPRSLSVGDVLRSAKGDAVRWCVTEVETGLRVVWVETVAPPVSAIGTIPFDALGDWVFVKSSAEELAARLRSAFASCGVPVSSRDLRGER